MKRLLPLLLLLVSSAVLAESGAYRVEVIVFRNLLATAKFTETPELRSFSQFPDLEETSPVGNWPAGSTDHLRQPVPADFSGNLRYDLPDDLFFVKEKSSQMDTAWKRLRSSQNYRPLVYTAWQQNRIDYYPPIRIHDQQIMDTRLHSPGQFMVADLTAQDPLASYRKNLYRIDGSLQLKRSRFLHLYIDLEYREATPQNSVEAGFLGGNDLQAEPGTPVAEADVYGVYELKQNRQIRTGKMQYFDTPFLGALVYVTSMQPE
ncbi:MAG: CsiV family protein [Xanthomonadales bacterium]|nr:CsiV family protein [Xanthomonadales bacterium]